MRPFALECVERVVALERDADCGRGIWGLKIAKRLVERSIEQSAGVQVSKAVLSPRTMLERFLASPPVAPP